MKASLEESRNDPRSAQAAQPPGDMPQPRRFTRQDAPTGKGMGISALLYEVCCFPILGLENAELAAFPFCA
ncbi:MAG: hypothetical protein ACO34J_08375 [Prochlorothrix sp.]